MERHPIGCGCGVIEPEGDTLNRARAAMADVSKMRLQIDALEQRIAKEDEKGRRLFGGGDTCDACEGRGWYDFDDSENGCTGYEPCPACDGYGVTAAMTCADHADDETD